MNIILDDQARRLAEKDRIPLDTIGVYTDVCGTSYYWVHAMINQKLIFDFDQCDSIESGLQKAKRQLK